MWLLSPSSNRRWQGQVHRTRIRPAGLFWKLYEPAGKKACIDSSPSGAATYGCGSAAIWLCGWNVESARGRAPGIDVDVDQ